MCIAAEKKNRIKRGRFFVKENFPKRIRINDNNAMGVNISGITWLTVQETPVKKDNRTIISNEVFRDLLFKINLINSKIR
jgi:hypothetical protein